MIDALRRLLARVVRWLEGMHVACFACSVASLKAAHVWILALPSELSKEALRAGLAVDSAGVSRGGQTSTQGHTAANDTIWTNLSSRADAALPAPNTREDGSQLKNTKRLQPRCMR